MLYMSYYSNATEILPRLWLGNCKASQDVSFFKVKRIECVINLTESEPFMDYLTIKTKQRFVIETTTHLSIYFDLIKDLIQQSITLIHSDDTIEGKHISGVMALMYLIKVGQMTPESGLIALKSKMSDLPESIIDLLPVDPPSINMQSPEQTYQSNPVNFQSTPINPQLNSVNSQLNPVNSQLNPVNSQLNSVNSQLNPVNSQLNPVNFQPTQIYQSNPVNFQLTQRYQSNPINFQPTQIYQSNPVISQSYQSNPVISQSYQPNPVISQPMQIYQPNPVISQPIYYEQSKYYNNLLPFDLQSSINQLLNSNLNSLIYPKIQSPPEIIQDLDPELEFDSDYDSSDLDLSD